IIRPGPETHTLVWPTRPNLVYLCVSHGDTLPPHDCVQCTASPLSITRPCHRTQPTKQTTIRPCGVNRMVFSFFQNFVFCVF
ncbi:hypothetical protein J1N35_037011, partial [Gossypium stocksii]